jgi:hypothetical protein
MYEAWEARIKELTAYVQCHTDTAHSRSRSIAQGVGTTTVHQGAQQATLRNQKQKSRWRQLCTCGPRLRHPHWQPPPKQRRSRSASSLSRSDLRPLVTTVSSTMVPRSSTKRVLR